VILPYSLELQSTVSSPGLARGNRTTSPPSVSVLPCKVGCCGSTRLSPKVTIHPRIPVFASRLAFPQSPRCQESHFFPIYSFPPQLLLFLSISKCYDALVRMPHRDAYRGLMAGQLSRRFLFSFDSHPVSRHELLLFFFRPSDKTWTFLHPNYSPPLPHDRPFCSTRIPNCFRLNLSYVFQHSFRPKNLPPPIFLFFQRFPRLSFILPSTWLRFCRASPYLFPGLSLPSVLP